MFPCLSIHKHKYQHYTVDCLFFLSHFYGAQREFVWRFSSLIIFVDILESNRRQLDYSIILSEKKNNYPTQAIIFTKCSGFFSDLYPGCTSLYPSETTCCMLVLYSPACQHLAIKEVICKLSGVYLTNTERNLMPCLSIFKCNFEWAIIFLAV